MSSSDGAVVTAHVSAEPLDVAAAAAAASAPECGGIALFVGAVRESAAVASEAGKRVVRLDYEAHEDLADRRLAAIARAAADKWDVRRVVAVHRVGRCALGDPTVVVACGAPHRADALEACRWMIDEIKSTVPIWKREVYEDGSAWVGAEGAS